MSDYTQRLSKYQRLSKKKIFRGLVNITVILNFINLINSLNIVYLMV